MGTSIEKTPDTIRLVLQNINGIPNNTKGAMKMDCLHTFTTENNIDILALTELNTAWDCLDNKDRHWQKHGDGGKQTSGVSLTTNKTHTGTTFNLEGQPFWS